MMPAAVRSLLPVILRIVRSMAGYIFIGSENNLDKREVFVEKRLTLKIRVDIISRLIGI